ncbi:hypothetical protein FLAG1_09601 [Fusarium langsethiae]|uniref:HNH nuclease domain-containing protein n=1 Tax=Fusarium langsethiae TaxID=179993 RepID=A0A0M9EQK0_FUSLA|nr:hypothetical protein FLAG1_09601 [Fusarium langsethiae]GKU06708.1 unnamed protein product [Fusarium langsethiae]GKU22791.1 unnamed protein product [Fusarium langsethiae]
MTSQSKETSLFEEVLDLILECPATQTQTSAFLKHRQESVEPPEEVLPSNLIDQKLPDIRKIVSKTQMNINNPVLNGIHFAVLLYMPANSLEDFDNQPNLSLTGLFEAIKTLDYLSNLLGFYTRATEPTMASALDRLMNEVQTPYMCWNMITLSPDLRAMWASGMFALKWQASEPLGTNKVRIRLQFVWMPYNVSRRRDSPFDLLQDDLREGLNHVWGKETLASPCTMSDCLACKRANTISAHNAETGRRIRSGDIFTISRDANDMLVCRLAFELQWILVCAHAVSGDD